MASLVAPVTPTLHSPSPCKGSPRKSRTPQDSRLTSARDSMQPASAKSPLTSPSANTKKVSPAGKNVTVPKGVCVFCLRADDNEDLYGKKLTRNSLSCHHFCLLFASGLMQFGKSDTEGLLGFLPRDIMKEFRRARRLRCAYCSNVGATIGCALSKCRVTFHLGCGLENDVLNQYFGTFSSYCPDHRPMQKVAASTANTVSPLKDIHTCAICMSAVTAKPSTTSLCTPCCQNAWYHRTCMQNQAKYAGVHFFKCPLCNNKDKFQKEMLRFGIYIPDQDAAWELEENAFQDLLHRHNRCDQRKCRCPRGRSFINKKWTIILCNACGSMGAHVQCAELKSAKARWHCPDCKQLLGSAKKKSPGSGSKLDLDPSKFQSLYPGPSGIPKKRKRVSDGSDMQPRKKNKKNADPAMGIQYTMQRQVLPRRQWRLRQGQEEDISMDLANKPPWVQRLLQDDIITGANLGRKLQDFRFCKPGEKIPLPPACKEAVEALGPWRLRVRLAKLEVNPSLLVVSHLQRLHEDGDKMMATILANSSADVAATIQAPPAMTEAHDEQQQQTKVNKAKVQLDFTKIDTETPRLCRKCSSTLFPFDEHELCVQHRICGTFRKNRPQRTCSVCLTWPKEKFQMLKQEMERTGVMPRALKLTLSSHGATQSPSSLSAPATPHGSPARLGPRRQSNSPYRTRGSVQPEVATPNSTTSSSSVGTPANQPTPQNNPVTKITPPVPGRLVRSSSGGRKSRRLPIVPGQRSIVGFLQQPSPESMRSVTSPPELSPASSVTATSLLSSPPLLSPQQAMPQELTPGPSAADLIPQPDFTESAPRRQSTTLSYASPVSELTPPTIPEPQPGPSWMVDHPSAGQFPVPLSSPPATTADDTDSDDEVQITKVQGPRCTCRPRNPVMPAPATCSPLLPIQQPHQQPYPIAQLYHNLAAPRPAYTSILRCPSPLTRAGPLTMPPTALQPATITSPFMQVPMQAPINMAPINMAACRPRPVGKENLAYPVPTLSPYFPQNLR